MRMDSIPIGVDHSIVADNNVRGLMGNLGITVMPTNHNSNLPTIGWREWIRLPELEIGRIKAKIDTGARSSTLHAFDLELFEMAGVQYVRFRVQPRQRDHGKIIEVAARVVDFRRVRSSNGLATTRPVIRTEVEILGQKHLVDVTLVDRGRMGFRMLIGREAIRGRFLVDSARSYYAGKPRKRKI